VRYRRNPALDIQALSSEIQDLERERDSIERRIDSLEIVRFTEPKVDKLRKESLEIDQRIRAMRGQIEAHLLAQRQAEEAVKGPQQLSLFARKNPSRSRTSQEKTMAKTNDVFRMTRAELVRSGSSAAMAELRRRGRDAEGKKVGSKKAGARRSVTKARESADRSTSAKSSRKKAVTKKKTTVKSMKRAHSMVAPAKRKTVKKAVKTTKKASKTTKKASKPRTRSVKAKTRSAKKR
jgi:hypothetical protein